jgi:hypothetical protein
MADPVLGLTELLEGDSLGYLRQNDRNLIMVRLAVDPRVQTDALTAPPGTVTRSHMWLLLGAGTGQWAGHGANTLCVALAANPTSARGWFFYPATPGMRIWGTSGTNTGHRVFDGTNWVAV